MFGFSSHDSAVFGGLTREFLGGDPTKMESGCESEKNGTLPEILTAKTPQKIQARLRKLAI